MAAAISFSRFLAARPATRPRCLRHPSIQPARLLPAAVSLRQNPPLLRRRFSAQENNGVTEETLAEKKEEIQVKEEEKSSEVAAEIRQMLAARKERSKMEELVGGVAEEIREIEWPEFGKVVGTTGVVIAVIAGSSVVLLTVNAILAELSDGVFVGKGVQDFFSG